MDDPGQPDFGSTTALCSVEGAFEAGATYTLATPLTLEATERAYYDTFLYRIQENSAAQRASQRAGALFERGTGGVLKAVPVTKGAAARSTDLNPYDNQQDADFRTENTADFVAYGDQVAGPEGATVKADIGFRNEGPAWIGHIRSGEDVATVDFTVPQGASVIAKPDRCRAVTADGKYREDQTSPAPRYVCNTSMTVRDGSGLDLPFELRVDKAMVGASGAVTVRNTWLQNPKLPFDPKLYQQHRVPRPERRGRLRIRRDDGRRRRRFRRTLHPADRGPGPGEEPVRRLGILGVHDVRRHGGDDRGLRRRSRLDGIDRPDRLGHGGRGAGGGPGAVHGGTTTGRAARLTGGREGGGEPASARTFRCGRPGRPRDRPHMG